MKRKICPQPALLFWKFIKNSVKSWKNIVGIFLVIGSFVALVVFKVPSPIVIIAGAFIGILSYVVTTIKKCDKIEGEK